MVFRIWDGVMLDGNETLIRAVLSIWKVLEEPIIETSSADQFYQLMSKMCNQESKVTENELFSCIYSLVRVQYQKVFEEFLFHHSPF